MRVHKTLNLTDMGATDTEYDGVSSLASMHQKPELGSSGLEEVTDFRTREIGLFATGGAVAGEALTVLTGQQLGSPSRFHPGLQNMNTACGACW